MREDRQLKAIHLFLDFKPLSGKFQDMGNAIRVNDPWLAWIDVSVPRFLAREGTVLVKLPSYCSPREAAVPREEIASSYLSLEAEIDQFLPEEEREEQGEPVIQVSDSEDELDKSSGVCTSGFIVECIARRLEEEEEEEEEMPLERKRGLRALLAGRAERLATKDTLRSQLPPPFPPHPSANPFAPTNLKKRKKDKEVAEEGELVSYNEEFPPKFSKTAKGKGRASSAESKEDRHMVEVRPQNPAWNPQLELDGAAIPWNSTIKEF